MKPHLTQINRTKLELIFCTSKCARVVIDYIPAKEEGHETEVVINGVDHSGETYYIDSFSGYEVSITHYYHEIVVLIQKEKK